MHLLVPAYALVPCISKTICMTLITYHELSHVFHKDLRQIDTVREIGYTMPMPI